MLRNSTKTTLSIAALLALVVAQAPVSATEFLNEDFESYTIDNSSGQPNDPINFPNYDPNDNQPSTLAPNTSVFNDLYVVVDNSSISPNTDQIGRLFDDSGGSLDYRSSVLDFQGESSFYSRFTFNLDNERIQSNTVRISFSKAGNNANNPLLGLSINGYWEDLDEDTNEDPNEWLVRVTPYTDNNWNSPHAGRFSDLARYEDNLVEIFANQHDTNLLTYTGPDSQIYTLYQNTYDVWINGVRGGGRDPDSSSPDDQNYRMKGVNRSNDNSEVGDSANLALTMATVNVNSNPNLDFFSMELDDILVNSLESAGLAGDLNGDGLIDGIDFLYWQRGETSPPLDQGLLAEWEAGYGASSTVASVAPIPEPMTVLLLAMGGATCLLIRKRVG